MWKDGDDSLSKEGNYFLRLTNAHRDFISSSRSPSGDTVILVAGGNDEPVENAPGSEDKDGKYTAYSVDALVATSVFIRLLLHDSRDFRLVAVACTFELEE